MFEYSQRSNTEEYRDGWETIFGDKKSVDDDREIGGNANEADFSKVRDT